MSEAPGYDFARTVGRQAHEFSGNSGGGGKRESGDDSGGAWGEQGLKVIISLAAGKPNVNTKF